MISQIALLTPCIFPGTDRAPTSRNHKANAPKRQRFGIFKQTPAADQSFEEI
jgi:hypothetical protein